jgi:hypothetical protein
MLDAAIRLARMQHYRTSNSCNVAGLLLLYVSMSKGHASVKHQPINLCVLLRCWSADLLLLR